MSTASLSKMCMTEPQKLKTKLKKLIEDEIEERSDKVLVTTEDVRKHLAEKIRFATLNKLNHQ